MCELIEGGKKKPNKMKAKLLAAKPWWCKHHISLSKKLCSEKERERKS